MIGLDSHFSTLMPNGGHAMSSAAAMPTERGSGGPPLLVVLGSTTLQDVDGDGIPDARDLCVLEPEDLDGRLDTDAVSYTHLTLPTNREV